MFGKKVTKKELKNILGKMNIEVTFYDCLLPSVHPIDYGKRSIVRQDLKFLEDRLEITRRVDFGRLMKCLDKINALYEVLGYEYSEGGNSVAVKKKK